MTAVAEARSTTAARRSYAPWVLALVLLLPAVLPLAAPGYFFKAHDAHHSVFWLVEYDRAVGDGAWWPVWAPDHALGFGYPLWLVYAPLAYTVAEFFHLVGLGFTAAVKATWLLGFVLGALGMYRLARRWWGSGAALVAALAFTYAPYHLAQIYVRADLAEFMAWSWFPWAMLALVALWDHPGPQPAAVAGLALGVLLMFHTVSLLIFAPFLFGYVCLELWLAWRPKGSMPWRSLGWTASAALLGGMLVMVYLLPGLFELRYLVQSDWLNPNYDYTRQFVYLSQFLSPFWGYGYALAGPDDGMSFQLGLLPFLGGILGTVAIVASRGRTVRQDAPAGQPGPQLPYRAEAIFLLLVTLAGIFMMTGASVSVWRLLPFGRLIQFPWRLLALTMVTLALLSAVGVRWLDGRQQRGPSGYVYVAALLIVLASFPYLRPELQPIRPEDESPIAVMEFEMAYPDMRGSTRFGQRQPANGDSPLVDQYFAGRPLQRFAILGGDGQILEQNARASSGTARLRANSELALRYFVYYFPGWQATVDGRPVQIRPEGPNGLIGLTVPPGEHDVRIWYGTTPDRLLGIALSLLALAVALVLFILGRRPAQPR